MRIDQLLLSPTNRCISLCCPWRDTINKSRSKSGEPRRMPGGARTHQRLRITESTGSTGIHLSGANIGARVRNVLEVIDLLGDSIDGAFNCRRYFLSLREENGGRCCCRSDSYRPRRPFARDNQGDPTDRAQAERIREVDRVPARKPVEIEPPSQPNRVHLRGLPRMRMRPPVMPRAARVGRPRLEALCGTSYEPSKKAPVRGRACSHPPTFRCTMGMLLPSAPVSGARSTHRVSDGADLRPGESTRVP